MNKLNDDQFVEKICSYLDRSLEDIDPAYSTRLDEIRSSAFSQRPAIAQDDEVLLDSIVTRSEDQAPLSNDIEQRLNQMRREAVTRVNSDSKKHSLLSSAKNWIEDIFANCYSVPVSMVATACLTVTVVTLFYTSSDPANDFSVDEELMLVASAEDLELYENLDFYLWLEETGFENL